MENYNGFLRNIGKMNSVNDGTRTLFESVVSNEVLAALRTWCMFNESDCVLIGGLALSYYVKPRATTDIDVLYLRKEDIPEQVISFRRHRKSAFEHDTTQVEVEVLTPEHINLPQHIAQAVFDTAIEQDIKVASPSALIATKLFRFDRQDQADIEALCNCCEIDLTPFNLPQEILDKFEEFKK